MVTGGNAPVKYWNSFNNKNARIKDLAAKNNKNYVYASIKQQNWSRIILLTREIEIYLKYVQNHSLQ